MIQETEKVKISDKLNLITDYWKPVIVGELNNQHVRLVKIKGEFVMHHHDNEDEFFSCSKRSFKNGLWQQDHRCK